MTDTITNYIDRATGIFFVAVAAALFVSPVVAMLSSSLIGMI